MKDQQAPSWVDDPEHWYRNTKGRLFRNEEAYPVDGSVRVPSEEARWELRRREELAREYYERKDQISYEEMLTRKLLTAERELLKRAT